MVDSMFVGCAGYVEYSLSDHGFGNSLIHGSQK